MPKGKEGSESDAIRFGKMLDITPERVVQLAKSTGPDHPVRDAVRAGKFWQHEWNKEWRFSDGAPDEIRRQWPHYPWKST